MNDPYKTPGYCVLIELDELAPVLADAPDDDVAAEAIIHDHLQKKLAPRGITVIEVESPDRPDGKLVEEACRRLGWGGASLARWQEVIGAWARRTFRHTDAGILKHLEGEEFDEFRRAIGTAELREEAADVVILLLSLAFEQGWSLEHAVRDKHLTNAGRTWGSPDANGVSHHVGHEPAAPATDCEIRYARQGDQVRLRLQGLTNHEIREVLVGLWSRLDEADRADHIAELVHYLTDAGSRLSPVARAIADGETGDGVIDVGRLVASEMQEHGHGE